MTKLNLSVRAYQRLLKLARKIADLAAVSTFGRQKVTMG